MTRIEAAGITAAGIALIGFLSMLFVNASLWFDLRSLQISDSRVGQAVQITYDREFYRDFDGAWRVLVWQVDRGERRSYCEASGSWGYRKAAPEQHKDLAWLVDGEPRCANLPAGAYAVEVKLTANPGSFVARSEAITSNVFEVRP